MPEGDTVFLTGQRLHQALSGRTLLRADIRHPRLATVELVGHTVNSVISVGKHLFIRFSNEYSLHSHLRMDGSWHLYRPTERWRSPAHQARVILAVTDKIAVGFRVHDLELLPTAREDQLVGHLGPDLLDPQWTDSHEDEATRRLTAAHDRELGDALLDQRIMAGIGNLYKTEICFLLGVSPWTPVSAVDARNVVQLSRKLLLRNAWRPEQSTTGYLGDRQHWVFERHRQGCLRCGGVVRVAKQYSYGLPRVAYYCPQCQPGPHPG